MHAALERRSSIFESKMKAREAEEKNNNSERLVHKALVKRWRHAKIGLYEDLCLFEELRDEGTNRTSRDSQLEEAFELWEEVRDDCCNILGCTHSQKVVGDIESEEGYEDVQSVDYRQKQMKTVYSKFH